jgi:hypothetical protein
MVPGAEGKRTTTVITKGDDIDRVA